MAKTKILGEPFDTYVDEQITVRQTRLGQTQKTSDDLVVFNASTPWIRLTSSVSVGADRAEKLVRNIGGGISLKDVVGSNLAKNLVLFAGSSEGAGGTQKGGLTRGGLKGAYGFLTDPKTQGYKPMPGITSISTNYKNNGSLKQAQVNLKCFSKGQFEAIETLYLRLGYTLTLEYGHSIYYNNGTKKQNMSALEIPNILFIDKLPKVSKEEVEAAALAAAAEVTDEYEKMAVAIIAKGRAERNPKYAVRIQTAIKDNKVKTSGNYDALVAKVSNFSWKLNPDLSYDIVLNLISVGDIIDSLKMNLGGAGGMITPPLQGTVDNNQQNILNLQLAKNTTLLNTFLFELTEQITSPEAQLQLIEGTNELIDNANSVALSAEVLEKLRKEYLDVINEQREKYINPYDSLTTFVNDKKITVKPPSTNANQGTHTNWVFVDQSYQARYQELIDALPNTELTYQTLDDPSFSEYADNNRNTERYINNLGFEFGTYTIAEDGKPDIEGRKIVGSTKANNFTEALKDTKAGLNKVESYIKVGLQALITEPSTAADGEEIVGVDTTKEIDYLSKQSNNNKINTTLLRMYDYGYWDPDGFYRHKDFKFSNNTRYITILSTTEVDPGGLPTTKAPVAAFVLPTLTVGEIVKDAGESTLDTVREFLGNLF